MSDLLDFTNDKAPGEIDDGTYFCRVDEAEMKDSKTGGVYVKVKFDILKVDGEEKVGVIFHNFNIKNSNEQAEKIGRGQLKQFCEFSGGPVKLEDILQLGGLKCRCTVKNKLNDYTGSMQPNITSFKK